MSFRLGICSDARAGNKVRPACILAIALCTLVITACASSSTKKEIQTQVADLRLQVQKLQRDVTAAASTAETANSKAIAVNATARNAQIVADNALAGMQAVMSAADATNEKIDRQFKRSAPAPEVEPNYTTVRVFYATDRDATGGPDIQYGTGRSSLTYGVCDVTIPNDHQLGEVESPKWWRFEFREDPKQHVVLKRVQKEEPDQLFSQLKERVMASSGKNAFVFVHGYNTTFADAAKRTAQITYDLKFEGAPVFYSWPSQGTVEGYPVDENNVDWATQDLQSFLTDFIAQTNADNIFLIAHSMGSRALTRAFQNLVAADPTVRNRIREVILAAPDIDTDVFKRDIAPALTGAPGHRTSVTLYASSRDKALMLSKRFHGYARVGDSTKSILTVQGVDTIDASAVDTSFLGHSYFAGTRSVLEDIYALMTSHLRACNRFGMNEVPGGGTTHCALEP